MKHCAKKKKSNEIISLVVCVVMGIAAVLADLFVGVIYEPMQQVFNLVFSAICDNGYMGHMLSFGAGVI